MKKTLFIILFCVNYVSAQTACQCLQKKINVMQETLSTFNNVCSLMQKTYQGEQALFEAYVHQLEQVIKELLATTGEQNELAQKLYTMNEYLRQYEQFEFDEFVKALGQEVCIQDQ